MATQASAPVAAQVLAAQSAHTVSAVAVAATDKREAPFIWIPQVVLVTQGPDPSGGPKVVPATHDGQDASVVAVPAILRSVPVQASKAAVALQFDKSVAAHVPAVQSAHTASAVAVAATDKREAPFA